MEQGGQLGGHLDHVMSPLHDCWCHGADSFIVHGSTPSSTAKLQQFQEQHWASLVLHASSLGRVFIYWEGDFGAMPTACVCSPVALCADADTQS